LSLAAEATQCRLGKLPEVILLTIEFSFLKPEIAFNLSRLPSFSESKAFHMLTLPPRALDELATPTLSFTKAQGMFHL
jgi:hypothetical protein